ncbi:MAG: pitrilysin family protein [Elainellaceae cyanobacterium]
MSSFCSTQPPDKAQAQLEPSDSGHALSPRWHRTGGWQRRLTTWWIVGIVCALILGIAGGLAPVAYAQDIDAAEPSLVQNSPPPSTQEARQEAETGDRSTNMQPYIDQAMGQITEFTLDNGMTFIVMERHQAPVISFMTYVNVGGVDEEEGKTGAAHYLEHLAFKGTQDIGTKDYGAEAEQFAILDRLFDRIQQARADGDEETLKELQEEFDAAQAKASSYVIQNQYALIVDQAGGVGLNATTSADATRYFYSFPSNKLELWMSVESERFLDPVFREFYEEKAVILEERRMRVDNSPVGKMVEEFLATAYQEHPYRRPIIGYETDLQAMTRQDIQEFFDRYYTPNHMIFSVVGDVDPQRVKRLAEVYFSRYAPGQTITRDLPDEPIQTEPREVVLELPSQPWYFEGYHMPSVEDPDYLVHQVITSILANGRTSRLYQSLVEKQQVALNAQCFSDFPGNRYGNLMVLYALTAPGHSVEEVEGAIATELERLRTELVSTEELDRVKTQWRASILQTLDSNRGMASLLPEYEAKTGSWQNLFEELKQIEAIEPEDVLRVAQFTFSPEKRTVGKILSESSSES